MNYLKVRRVLRKVKNTVLKELIWMNLASLLFWMCLVDVIISWQPVAIMLVNCFFLWLMAYANGYVYDTERYYERQKKKGEF